MPETTVVNHYVMPGINSKSLHDMRGIAVENYWISLQLWFSEEYNNYSIKIMYIYLIDKKQDKTLEPFVVIFNSRCK